MRDEPSISPIPIGGTVPPPEENIRQIPPPPIALDPLPAADGDGEVVRLRTDSSDPPESQTPLATPAPPVPLPGIPKRNAPTPALAPAAIQPENHAFTAATGLVLLLTALFVPHWTWAQTVSDGYPSSPIAAWLATHSGGTPFAGDLWQGLRAALLTAGAGMAAGVLYRHHLRHRSLARAVLHVASTTLVLVVLGIVILSLGEDSTRWDFSETLTCAGLVYPVVALLWSRPRWVQLLLAALVFAGSWFLFSKPSPEGLTAAQASLQPLLPTLGLMLVGLAAGETLLPSADPSAPRKPAVRAFAVFAAGAALAAGGWALHHFGIALERIPDARIGTLFLGCGAVIAAAGLFAFIPRRALPFTVIGTWGIAFYTALHTLAPALHGIFSTHFGAGYLSFIGTPATPLAQNIAVALLLWLAAAWLSCRKIPSS